MPHRTSKFTDDWVQRLKPPASGEQLWVHRAGDKGVPTLCLRVSYGGTKTWKILFYEGGRTRYRTLKKFSQMPVTDAYAALKKFSLEHEKAASKAGTFETVADQWFDECIKLPKRASAPELRRHLDTYILPEWKDKRFYDIDSHAVDALLTKIRKKEIDPVLSSETRGARGRRKKGLGGPVMAEVVRGTIRNIMFWYWDKHPDYKPPIQPGSKRRKGGSARKKRERFLDDDEIRLVWQACDDIALPRKDGKSVVLRATYGKLVKLLLLTTQRLSMVADMKHSDLRDGVKLPTRDRSKPPQIVDGVWIMRASENELAKGVGGALKLPKMALDIIASIPKVDGIEYVFHARAKGSPVNKPINSFSQLKTELDALLPAEMRGAKAPKAWRLHDLRRTGRTLMPQAGVPEYVAERTLGHVQPGIVAVYNQYDYFAEKADALDKLSTVIGNILNPIDPDAAEPDTSNVVSLRNKTA